jgi:hypothetical protein
LRLLSTRARAELWRCQATLRATAEERRAALRVLLASRHTVIGPAQRELWQEFSYIDQEYRFAVLQLADFCNDHTNRLARRR